MASRMTYSTTQIVFHWLVAILIAAAYILSDGMGQALRQRIDAGQTGIEGNTLHVWLGGAAFLLILIRIVIRIVSGAPEAAGSGLQQRAAKWGHLALYVLMVAVPFLGAMTWYLFVRPAGELHELLANALMIVAGGHAVLALYHQFYLKDGTLNRMTRPGA